jgi:predicted component of type VI protein secretion system
MQSSYRLVMRAGPTVGKVYPLEKAEAFVGRDVNNEVVINDPEISRRHAHFVLQGGSYILEDLGSTNGTFANGQRLQAAYVLRPGDTITFGERISLVFELIEVDPDATVVSPAARVRPPEVQPTPQYMPRAQEPVYTPQPAPSAQPVPVYSGQVPESYPADYAAPVAPTGQRSRMAWIIAIVILLLLCLCITLFLFFAPKSFWCFFPIWPAGACP